MKFNPFVTSDRSKNRKRHFNAPSHIRRKIMSSPLSKERKDRSTTFNPCPSERMMKFRYVSVFRSSCQISCTLLTNDGLKCKLLFSPLLFGENLLSQASDAVMIKQKRDGLEPVHWLGIIFFWVCLVIREAFENQ